ncbi:MAG: hypothetical protein UY96_C0015G0005 [Parcubacteria group bacterium GW2011_GWB1_56_8]|nr:MAG: hypothetical protein UY96_C0015G0005 [Parcubacteria group bacterium GW2011_GWB1_56_8]
MKEGLSIEHNDQGLVLIRFDKPTEGMAMPFQIAAAIAIDLMDHAKKAQEQQRRIIMN